MITNDRKIAESFNDYLVNIGAKLANEIENSPLDSSENNFFRPDFNLSFLKFINTKLFSNWINSKRQNLQELIYIDNTQNLS